MSAKTKIVVLKSKELIYTGIFIVLGILLVLLLIYMFSPSKDKKKKAKEENSNINIENSIESQSMETISMNEPQNEGIYTNDSVDISNYNNDTANNNDISNQANSKNDALITTTNSPNTYKDGIYSSILNIGGQTNLQMVVTVDNKKVSHIEISNLSEAITTMYPLLSPSVDEINLQLESGLDFDNLSFSKENQYTTTLILQAIKDALKSANQN